jgi:hypothetical protein
MIPLGKRASLLAALAVILTASAACGSSGTGAATGQRASQVHLPPDEPKSMGRTDWVVRLVPPALGRSYLCLTLSAHPERTVIVARRSAIPAVRRILRRIPGATRTTEIRLGNPRRREADLARIERALEESISRVPRLEDAVSIAPEQTHRRDVCPRISLGLADDAGKDPFVRRWAKDVVRRYGDDRVKIDYGINPTGT